MIQVPPLLVNHFAAGTSTPTGSTGPSHPLFGSPPLLTSALLLDHDATAVTDGAEFAMATALLEVM